eukprot:CAMPEP_0170058122 /NCGR_PEP_ID=MMETSP0019_2-20121128/863_1 /TAXON_ID=98059 /ORGANISM="Dinobryon sp., Strain UTEXLB2267" /LENGTH=122 /DNA_ID=CAMNT_0010262983 /DNA_START=1252 /DNA_END=1620 /DNA_ORIENTATION=-
MTNVYLAAPCYSFPGYSFVYSPHYPVNVHMPSCQPGESSQYFDNDPAAYLLRMIQDSIDITDRDYILTFDAYYNHKVFQNVTNHFHFKKVVMFPHAYFKYDYDDPFPKKHVIVLTKTTNQNI